MVDELVKKRCGVTRCCKVLQVSRSGYYSWLKRPDSQRKQSDQKLVLKLKEHWENSRKTYGLPRLQKKLRTEGLNHGKGKIRRLMLVSGIQGAGKKKYKVMTTDSNHSYPIAERIFKTEKYDEIVERPNQFWGGDITYVPTKEGFLYLSIFLDLFTRKVVGYSMNDTMTSELVIDSLDMGLKRQGITRPADLITHSDRGVQYAANAFKAKLTKHNIKASMSRKGNCYDNAYVESFFRTLKVELIYPGKFNTREEAKLAIFEFIEVWYNRQRLHSSLDYLTPEQYEQQHQAAA